MAPRIYYDDPDLGPIEITDSVKYGNGDIRLTMTAEQGTVATDNLQVEDPLGIYNFRGLRNIWVDEDAAEDGFQRVYTGWVWVRDIGRGDYYRTGAARQWDLQMQNINHVLFKRVMAGNDTDRPEETDVERIQWLLSTGEAAGITDTTTFVFTDRPVDMDANPDPGYNGQEFNQVVNDCAEQSGKNYYMLDVFIDYDVYGSAIWYGHDDLDEFVSEATISNVESEVDNVTVFWADVPAKLTRDPSRVWSGVFGSFDGGWVYETDAGTIADFTTRDTTASWPNVKSATRASARAVRMLNDLNNEEDAVTVAIWSMQHSQANVFRAGHRVNNVKFTHFPGWEGGRDCRIVRKTLIDQSTELYRMELDLLPIAPTSTLTCEEAVDSSEGTETDSGELNAAGPPLSFNPDNTTETSVVFVAHWSRNHTTGYGTGPIGIYAAPPSQVIFEDYTEIGNTRQQWPFSYSSFGVAAYRSNVNGDAGTCEINPPGMSSWFHARTISGAFQTSSSSPVNAGWQDGSGGAVTMDAPCTMGNYLVAVQFAEGTTGFMTTPGWEVIASELIYESTGSVMLGRILARCVSNVGGDGNPGDDTTGIVQIGDTAFSHWTFVTEWTP